MKCLLIFFLLVMVTGNRAIDPSEFIFKILKALPCLMDKPIDILQLPVLDPFQLDHIKLNINLEDILKATGELDNLFLKGLATLQTTKDDTFFMKLSLAEITLLTDYVIDARIMDELNIWGTGNIVLTIKEVDFKLTLKFKSGSMGIDDLDCSLDIGSLEVDISGLFDDEILSNAISESITESFKEIFNEYKDDIDLFIKQKGPSLLNNLLGDKSLGEGFGIYSKIVNDPKVKQCLDK